MSTPSPTSSRVPLPSGPALGLIGVLALFLILIGLKGELASFLTVGNLNVLVHEGTIKGIIALGVLLVIISGGIDLSVGAVVALVTVVTMRVYTHFHGQLGAEQASVLAVG